MTADVQDNACDSPEVPQYITEAALRSHLWSFVMDGAEVRHRNSFENQNKTPWVMIRKSEQVKVWREAASCYEKSINRLIGDEKIVSCRCSYLNITWEKSN